MGAGAAALSPYRSFPLALPVLFPPLCERGARSSGACEMGVSLGSPREGVLGTWPYHTSAAGLHSKMLLVHGLKCSQGKSATFSRNLGTCVGSRGLSLSSDLLIPRGTPSLRGCGRVPYLRAR